MRCSICGAKLKKPGDICSNCYKLVQEEKELSNDTKIVFEINRKYGIAYELTKYTWFFVVFIVSSFGCIAVGNTFAGILCILVLALVIGFLLFWDKQIAMATKAVFYETKVVYTFKFLFFDTEKVIKYSNIKDVKIYRTFTQRKYGYGDICIYASGAFPGAILLNGFEIKNVENVDEIVRNIIEHVANSTVQIQHNN